MARRRGIDVRLLIVMAGVLTAAAGCSAKAADTSLEQARASAAAGQFQAAVELTSKALAADPKNVEALSLRARLYRELREPAKAVADLDQLLTLQPTAAGYYDMRGRERFKLGRVREAVADFDKFLELRPGEKPGHWRRGIALYYTGQFKEGVEQFELHQTVNPNDVENAAWHYLCNVKVVGPEKAREALLKVGPDRRVSLMTVYRLYAGQAKPDDVLRDAEAGNPNAARRREQLFYAHLYIGLYHEAAGDVKAALEHVTKAVEFADPNYMGDVARVHVQLRKAKP
jgi:lipoprotein NlpI